MLLKVYTANNDLKGARGVLADIEAAGLRPNQISFNVLINIAVNTNSLREAWNLVDMMEASNVPHDQYTVATMMKAVKRMNSKQDVPRVFKLLDNVTVNGITDVALLN